MSSAPNRIPVVKSGRRPRGLLAGGTTALAFLAVAIGSYLAAEASPDNFTVHGAGSERGGRILQHAESARDRAFTTLLGNASPADWDVRCEIHLHASERSFAAAVGGPPDGSRGATSIEFAGSDVVLRRIDLMDDAIDDAIDDAMDDDHAGVPAALDHELVHVVLADRFTDAPPPRWADEGLAVLFDADDKQAAHDDDYRAARRSGMTWGVGHLLEMQDYPREVHRQRIFYGQSAALVRWLLDRGGTNTLMAFLDDVATVGHREALERHYGFTSASALERAWLAEPAGSDVGVD